MADECEVTNTVRIIREVRSVIMEIGVIVGLVLGAINLHKNETLEQKTDQHIQKSDTQRTTLEAAAGPNLLASWKYLQQLADDDPKNKLAQETAANAKKTYEDWLAKQRAK